MIDAIKGVARRTTQRLRDWRSGAGQEADNDSIAELQRGINQLAADGTNMEQRLVRIAQLMQSMSEEWLAIGTCYANLPVVHNQTGSPLSSKGVPLALSALAGQLSECSSKMEAGAIRLEELHVRAANAAKLEDARRDARLEFEFFDVKVRHLHASGQPQDATRIPRNELLLQHHREHLSSATEQSRVGMSDAFLEGRRLADTVLLDSLTITMKAADQTRGMLSHVIPATLPPYPTSLQLGPTPLLPLVSRGEHSSPGNSEAVIASSGYVPPPLPYDEPRRDASEEPVRVSTLSYHPPLV